MPVLWESTVLPPNPDIPQLKTLFPIYDSYDPNLAEHIRQSLEGEEHTKDYIPDAARAFAQKEYEVKPRQITIQVGDRVKILSKTQNKTPEPLFLVRTAQNTYAWLYAYHVEDKDGKRVSRLR